MTARIDEEGAELLLSEAIGQYLNANPDGHVQAPEIIGADLVLHAVGVLDSALVTVYGPEPGTCPGLVKGICDALEPFVDNVLVATQVVAIPRSLCDICQRPKYILRYHVRSGTGYVCIGPPTITSVLITQAQTNAEIGRLHEKLQQIEFVLERAANKPPPIISPHNITVQSR